MFSRWHRVLAVMQVLCAAALLAMEMAAGVMVPSAPDAAAARKPALLSGALFFAIYLLVPASLGFVVARRRRPKLLTALMIASMLLVVLSVGAVFLQITSMQAPVEAGTRAAQVLEAKFGLGIALSFLLMLVGVGQSTLCCREVCDRRCYRTRDTATSYVMDSDKDLQYRGKHNVTEVKVRHEKLITTQFSSPYDQSVTKGWSASFTRPAEPGSAPPAYSGHQSQLQPLFKQSSFQQCTPSAPPLPSSRPTRRPAPPPPTS